MKNIFYNTLVLLLLSAAVACNKTKIEPVDTYPPGPKPVVAFTDDKPVPATGSEGSTVTINVAGLEGKTGKFKFYFNQTEAEIVTVTATAITVKVPANASTGSVSVVYNGEYYYGPVFTVKGNVSINQNFDPSKLKSDGTIIGVYPQNEGNYVLYGGFTDYAISATATNVIRGLAVVNDDGKIAGTQFKMGAKGFDNSIYSIAESPANRYFFGGSFDAYNNKEDLKGMTSFASNGSMDTMQVDVINPDPVQFPNADKLWVPSFNGGVYGSVYKVFYNTTPRGPGVIAVGSFVAYVKKFYERSTVSSFQFEAVMAKQVIRMNENGSYDSTFNYNPATKSSYPGSNGYIQDAVMLSDGHIMAVGPFTTYNGVAAGRIVKINGTTGMPIPLSGGSGADGFIIGITYNATTNKIIIYGTFKNYNGVPANGVAVLNIDGSIDRSFVFKGTDGYVNYAGQMDDGRIIVSGRFTKYDTVIRPNMVIVNNDGTMAAGCNNIGLFNGAIYGMTQVWPSHSTGTSYMLVGSFTRFDNKEVGNIVIIDFKE